MISRCSIDICEVEIKLEIKKTQVVTQRTGCTVVNKRLYATSFKVQNRHSIFTFKNETDAQNPY